MSVFVCSCVRSDGAQPHLVNIQFQKKVKLQVWIQFSDTWRVVFLCLRKNKISYSFIGFWRLELTLRVSLFSFSWLYFMWISSLTRAIPPVRYQFVLAMDFTTWRCLIKFYGIHVCTCERVCLILNIFIVSIWFDIACSKLVLGDQDCGTCQAYWLGISILIWNWS